MSRLCLRAACFVFALTACLGSGASVQAQYGGYPYWGSAPSSYQMPMTIPVPGSNLRVWSDPLYAHPAHGATSPMSRGYGMYSFVPEYMPSLTGAGYQPRTNNAAHIRLRVPAGAEVWFNGNKTKQTGEDRNFYSPQLTPGQTYVYNLRVRWKKGSEEKEVTRKIRVHARESVPVDVTK